MHHTPHVDLAFNSVEHIMRDVEGGWLLCYMHANGASMFLIVVHPHIFRGLYYASYSSPREFVWCLGVVIFLLMIDTAFIGYVPPWGQMSLGHRRPPLIAHYDPLGSFPSPHQHSQATPRGRISTGTTSSSFPSSPVSSCRRRTPSAAPSPFNSTAPIASSPLVAASGLEHCPTSLPEPSRRRAPLCRRLGRHGNPTSSHPLPFPRPPEGAP
jgi:hypothetical protein